MARVVPLNADGFVRREQNILKSKQLTGVPGCLQRFGGNRRVLLQHSNKITMFEAKALVYQHHDCNLLL